MRNLIYGVAISLFAVIETILSRSIAQSTLSSLYDDIIRNFGDAVGDVLYGCFAGLYIAASGPIIIWLFCVIAAAFLKAPWIKLIGAVTFLGSIAWSSLNALQLYHATAQIDYTVFLPVALTVFLMSRKSFRETLFGAAKPIKFIRGSHFDEVRHELRLLPFANRSNAMALSVGPYYIDERSETQHILVTGTTGSGKSQIIDGFLRTIRARGQRAIVVDPGGGFYARHARPGDIVLNPLDRRSVNWSPFAEIEADYDYDRIAKSIIPDATGESAQWHLYGQNFIANTMRAMKARHDKASGSLFDRVGMTPLDLFKWLTTASANQLADLLEGTSSAILCQASNERMLGSVRGTLTPYIDILRHLKQSDPYWSSRQWLRNEVTNDWLFLTYRDDQLGLLRNFVSTLSDITMLEALSLPEADDRRLWFVLDELDSVGRLGQLKDALVKLRKFGGCCILGIQTLAQLRLVYGKDMSQALIGNTATKVILRAGDAETAKAMEQELGEQEIERISTSQSSSKSAGSFFKAGSSSANRSTSVSIQTVRQSAMMASEIQKLPDLSGVLVRKSKPHVRFEIPYVKMPVVANPFEK